MTITKTGSTILNPLEIGISGAGSLTITRR